MMNPSAELLGAYLSTVQRTGSLYLANLEHSVPWNILGQWQREQPGFDLDCLDALADYRRRNPEGPTRPVAHLAHALSNMDPEDRELLMERVTRDWVEYQGCWFTAGVTKDDHQKVSVAGKVHPLHRVTYVDAHGPYPDRYHLHHTCLRKACYNPKHLIPLDESDHAMEHWNIEDGPFENTSAGKKASWPEVVKAIAKKPSTNEEDNSDCYEQAA